MAKVVVISDMCKSCRYCIGVCPKRVLETTDEVNRFGYKYVVPVKPEACIGCGMCASMCPDGAIEVYR